MGLCAAAVMARRATMAAATAKRAIWLVLLVVNGDSGTRRAAATNYGVVLWLCV
jgi:hypothetical protein